MIYIILVLVSLVLMGAALCTCARLGEKENICKYGYIEEEEQ